ncbi:hypothetical protein M0811_00641 [Anaeramoeba ignava]|uniref:Uncharacterized protein n=1 Tax=Anaeramoeba ignava TaxID=1746090 RepID=A0A9Q0LJN1_ANAIG|nr:hypothetical protein M0811_00641 [Anaeramoeba ignava]
MILLNSDILTTIMVLSFCKSKICFVFTCALISTLFGNNQFIERCGNTTLTIVCSFFGLLRYNIQPYIAPFTNRNTNDFKLIPQLDLIKSNSLHIFYSKYCKAGNNPEWRINSSTAKCKIKCAALNLTYLHLYQLDFYSIHWNDFKDRIPNNMYQLPVYLNVFVCGDIIPFCNFLNG